MTIFCMLNGEIRHLVLLKGLKNLVGNHALLRKFLKIPILFAEGSKLSACLNDRSMIGGQ